MQPCCGQAGTYKHPGYTIISVASNEEEHPSFVWTAGTFNRAFIIYIICDMVVGSLGVEHWSLVDSL